MKTKVMKMMVAALALSSFGLVGCGSSGTDAGDTGNSGNFNENLEGSVESNISIVEFQFGYQKFAWMAKNLNIEIDGSSCYDNNLDNCKEYGRLYTWDAAKNVCPTGWHLPRRWEVKKILENIGSNYVDISDALRDPSWNRGVSSRFSALPAGIYDSEIKEFNGLGNMTRFWVYDAESGDAAFLEVLDNSAYVSFSSNGEENNAYSVHCLQDSN